jgi:dTMP kinase
LNRGSGDEVASPAGGRTGLFLVFEGVEGAGKSTQVRLLDEWLTARGIPHEVTREPGGTRIGEEIRRLLLLGGDDVPARTELLLVLAARAALVDATIAPALAAGKVVVADRYELSTLAYQAGGRQLPTGSVREINAFATGGLRPDLTVFLDVPVEVGVARREAGGSGADRIEQAGREFHDRVASAYRLLAGTHQGVTRVDGTAPAEQVHAEVVALLKAKFAETFARAMG